MSAVAGSGGGLGSGQGGSDGLAVTLRQAVVRARVAQRAWQAVSLRNRLGVVRRLRGWLVERAEEVAVAGGGAWGRPLGEVYSSQVIPLAEACRYLEREAEGILRSRRLGRRGRPLWLMGVRAEVVREPHGVVLVIGASNYPLFLPGVQALQSVVAGNAVLVKPGAGGGAAARLLAELAVKAGLPEALWTVLPESVEAGQAAIEGGVDKVILTGSAETGRTVLERLAVRGVPATVELSGCDAVLVREDADLGLVTRALGFGLRLNGSATCMAPRRVFVPRRLVEQLEAHLQEALAVWDQVPLGAGVAARLGPLVQAALDQGAHLLTGGRTAAGEWMGPLVLSGARPSMALLQADVFAPVLSLVAVDDEAEAMVACEECPYALGASVFGRDVEGARRLGMRLRAGVVTVNDVIVPTADPRLPFGGRGRSGFGVTRGHEGLLEMTVPKVVTVRSSGRPPHLGPESKQDEAMFRAYLGMVHGVNWGDRWRAGWRLLRALLARGGGGAKQ